MWGVEHKQIQSASSCTSSKTNPHKETKVKITRERRKENSVIQERKGTETASKEEKTTELFKEKT